MERGVDGAFGEIDLALGLSSELLDHGVAMARAPLHDGKEQEVEVASECVSPHTSRRYT